MREGIATPRGTRLLRIAGHIREQNWTAIGIDFLIVVLGVFFGIQVRNWNQERQSRGQETRCWACTEAGTGVALTSTMRRL